MKVGSDEYNKLIEKWSKEAFQEELERDYDEWLATEDCK